MQQYKIDQSGHEEHGDRAEEQGDGAKDDGEGGAEEDDDTLSSG